MSSSKATTIIGITLDDVCFPTSKQLDESDAIDYLSAYLILYTYKLLLEGHGYSFTIDHETEIICVAIKTHTHLIFGRTLEDIFSISYFDKKIRHLCHEALNEGFTHLKIKIGRDFNDDIRRIKVIREEVSYTRRVMDDSTQVWDIDQAIEWMKHLVEF
ncbi:hypothetical protein I4U23_021080 [Adineta vaga]|nr:hypothetical protein I4U23_021080 [Adineta vaga]